MSWSNWTAEQRAALVAWLKAGGTGDTQRDTNALNLRPVLSWHDWDEEVMRDSILVIAEGEAKRIAALAGITAQDTPGQMDAKLKDMIAAAVSTADIKLTLYNATKFWSCYLTVKTVTASGAATETVHHHDPVYGQSPAQELGLGFVTGGDVESAWRAR